MADIETLITHFLGVSWGPVVPAGEAAVGIEAAKGNNTYYLVSDGNTVSYRTRIRTPSFAHLQTIPLLVQGAHGARPGRDTGEHGLCDGRLRQVRGDRDKGSSALSPFAAWSFDVQKSTPALPAARSFAHLNPFSRSPIIHGEDDC